MQIKILPTRRVSSQARLVISHKTDELFWDVSSQDDKADFDVFAEINGFWAHLPETTQDKIFDVYVRIYNTLMDVTELHLLVRALRPLVAELFKLHPEDDMLIWVWTKANVVVPPNIKRVFDPSADGRDDHRVERTYVEDDYRKLIALAVALRIMIPIWGQYMLNSKSKTDNLFKEYQAFELMTTSSVMEWNAMKRFTVFVNHTMPKERELSVVIVSGISSHDFPQWVLAQTVMRKLCRGDVRGSNPNTTFIAYLYVFITQRLRSIESSNGKIIEKYTPADKGESDNNLSLLEGFKIKEGVPAGDIAAVSFYIRYHLEKVIYGMEITPMSLAGRLSSDPKFPGMVKQSHDTVQALAAESLNKIQVTIAGWVLSRFIPIRSIPSLQKTDLLAMIAFAQSYLWINGHKDLAALVSAVSRSENGEEYNTLAIANDKIDKVESEELIRRFPYRKRTQRRAKNAKSTIPVLKAIDDMAETIAYQTWKLTLPSEWVSQITGNGRTRIYTAPHDIRTKIARLVIELDELKATPQALNAIV